jgi:hypothetical protein
MSSETQTAVAVNNAEAYERGVASGILSVLHRFEQELYVAHKEDPEYAVYVEDFIQIIKKMLQD